MNTSFRAGRPPIKTPEPSWDLYRILVVSLSAAGFTLWIALLVWANGYPRIFD